MMGERTVMQEALFYEFSLDRHVPPDHLLRSIDRFVDLSSLREHLRPYYSETGRPSIDPELMIRMLLVGYCLGIRSERRLCEEVHLNLAYRWFCRLGLEGAVPDHSTFSKNRHGRFRDSALLRRLFEASVERCMAEGLVGGEGFAVDASLIKADANRQRSVPVGEGLPAEAVGHAVREYLAVLDDAAFGAATPVVPKFISVADPASRWTAANGGLAFFAYSTNYLIDLKHAVIMDVEATTSIRQAEVTAQRRMLERTRERFGVWLQRLAADTGAACPGLDPGAPPRTSPGWSTSAASSRTSRCSTSRAGPTAPSAARRSSTIGDVTSIAAPAASRCGPAVRSSTMGPRCSIAPASSTATPAA
jgi:transposase